MTSDSIENSHRPAPDSVDVVVTYVDGSAPGFAEKYRSVVGHAPVPCQVRTLGELRYVLRSIHRYVPWARSVVLAVKDAGHVPSWLNRDRVRVVYEEDFLPDEVRPCFSPFAIQAWAYQIPGLSEKFLLWSDDQLVLFPTLQSDFFLSGGRPRPLLHAARPYSLQSNETRFGTRVANSFRALQEVMKRRSIDPGVAFPLVSHLPIPIDKELWGTFMAEFLPLPAFEESVRSRLRDGSEEPPVRMVVLELWSAWLWATKREAYPRWPPPGGRNQLKRLLEWAGLRRPNHGMFSIRHDPAWTCRQMKKLVRARPWFVCLNDDAYHPYEDPTGTVWQGQLELEPYSLGELQSGLDRLFPDPSPFEASG